MDTSLPPLPPVWQPTSAPAPVDGLDIRPLPPASASAASAAILPTNDEVIRLSNAARLLSAASATQGLSGTRNNRNSFSAVLGAAINFVSAVNGLNGNATQAVAGAGNGSGVSDLPTGTTPTGLLLQTLANAPLNVTASDSNAVSLLASLADIGITAQDSLSAAATPLLTVNGQALQDAFNSNPAATIAVLGQATASFAPLAVDLLEQDGKLFLSAQDLAPSTRIQDIFSPQLDLALAPGNPVTPAAVAAANVDLQRTLANEALNAAIQTNHAANAGGHPLIATPVDTNVATSAAPESATPDTGFAIAGEAANSSAPAAGNTAIAGTSQTVLESQPGLFDDPGASTDAAKMDTAAPAATSGTPNDSGTVTNNPDTIPVIDPALAAAIAAYNLRNPVSNIVDTRGAREVGDTGVDAVNGVESVSAVQPVMLKVHDEVAAAQRNAMLRNDPSRKSRK